MSASMPECLHMIVEKTVAEAKIPGCTVAVVDAAGPLWSGAFGYVDLRRRWRAEIDTVYPLFSGTKLFTAVAVLQLQERGLLALDDLVARFVPEGDAARGVTLLHLLSHQSGLKDTLKGFLSVTFPPEKAPTTAEVLERYRIAPARPPGRRVEYRNVNYALLGDVITRVSGLEYRDYVTEQVLAPLGMRVGYHLTDGMRERSATGYIGRWDPMRLALAWIFPDVPSRLYGNRVDGLLELKEYELATPAIGGLLGPMPEFGKFLRWQLAGGGEVLSPESTRRMQTPVAEGAAGIESRVGMGLGWKLGRVGERRFLNHEGGGAGFTSELRLYPAEGIGVALAMNVMRMPRTIRVAHRICEAVLAEADPMPGAHHEFGSTTHSSSARRPSSSSDFCRSRNRRSGSCSARERAFS